MHDITCYMIQQGDVLAGILGTALYWANQVIITIYVIDDVVVIDDVDSIHGSYYPCTVD